MAKVSIIIPAYNAALFIEETVQTVLTQTYSNIELIIVNDGSTDNTLKLLKHIEELDVRVKIITKKNSGVCDSRNKGLEIASGSFITFLDADDLWEPTFLEKTIILFDSNKNINAVYSKAQLINEKSEKLNSFIEATTIKNTGDILEWKNGYIASMGCTIYRKSTVDSVGMFDKNLSTAADQDFHLRIAKITPIVALNEILFYYRIHENNMHQNIKVMEKDHIYVFKKAEALNLYDSFWHKQKCFSKLYLILAGSWWKVGENKLKGIYYVSLSFLTYPPFIFNRFLQKIAS